MVTTLAKPDSIVKTLLAPIVNWEHWDTIKAACQREYSLTDEQWQAALPEYQKFLGIIRAGYTGVPMMSEVVDKIWHTHILCSTLYVPFCQQVMGRYVHHVPNLNSVEADCKDNKCVSPDPCLNKCLSICKTPPPKCTDKVNGETIDFSAVYKQLYGIPLPLVWNLKVADGISR